MIRAALAALLGLLSMTTAEAGCRQALALGLDISGSVDATEYRLQRDGLADALSRPAVRNALFSTPGEVVWIAVFEWADPGQSHVIQPWAALTDGAALDRVTARLRGGTRPDFGPSTALGSAMEAGAALLAGRPDCATLTLDVSGDGPSNTGPRPRDARRAPALAGVTVNGLVVAPDAKAASQLESYFRAEVISGPGAFVERADGFEGYADAMERKLIRELRSMLLGALQ
ncbi:Protein of unknown function [Palleronia salina]|uniref:VWFA domain-containing protein n=1 Tax=Palleronia salina TaxID=313368 RepID=A0A1M6G4G1_9RHOB|nr:DUF1194 domain-containing protein [Palleronia salina]SHJ04784.1 Protein of unknown function [Palleronia salina]